MLTLNSGGATINNLRSRLTETERLIDNTSQPLNHLEVGLSAGPGRLNQNLYHLVIEVLNTSWPLCRCLSGKIILNLLYTFGSPLAFFVGDNRIKRRLDCGLPGF